MSSVIRYQFVNNPSTTGPLTVDKFTLNTDGDDVQNKRVKRVLSAGDIGSNPGQVGDPYGAIVTIVPMTQTVLMVQGSVYRPGVQQNGMTPYNPIDNQVEDVAPSLVAVEVLYGVGLDNTIRVIDKAHDTAPLQVGDLIIVELTIGTRRNPLDVMNP